VLLDANFQNIMRARVGDHFDEIVTGLRHFSYPFAAAVRFFAERNRLQILRRAHTKTGGVVVFLLLGYFHRKLMSLADAYDVSVVGLAAHQTSNRRRRLDTLRLGHGLRKRAGRENAQSEHHP